MKLQKIYLSTFLLAIFVRSCLIYFTPEKNKLIDLLIYRDAGQLVVNGINPYDYDDQKELRHYMRLDSVSFNAYTSKDQDSWDYFAGSNLPMATLCFGLIEYFFASSLSYRFIFAFFRKIDSRCHILASRIRALTQLIIFLLTSNSFCVDA